MGAHPSGHPPIQGYQFVRTLGRGGFATTHLYRNSTGEFGEYVAVKAPHDKEREEALIKGDIPSLASLRDTPNIVQYLTISRVGDGYVLLLEYVDGPLLRQLLGMPGTPNRLPLAKALRYVLQVADGLEAAHTRHMVHRDIKPENIIIENATDTAKILDFGMASLTNQAGSFETEFGGHTPFYSPCEILIDRKGDHRVDIYSLGVTFYEMLTGTLPFYEKDITPFRLIEMMRTQTPEPPRSLVPEIPAYVNAAVMKCISRRPDERFAGIAALKEALEPPSELKTAMDLMAGGAARRAEHLLRRVVDQRPEDSRCLLALAQLLNRCRRPAEAVGFLEKAVSVDPADADAHFRLGMTWMEMNDRDRAGEAFSRAEKLCRDEKLKRRIAVVKKSLGHTRNTPQR